MLLKMVNIRMRKTGKLFTYTFAGIILLFTILAEFLANDLPLLVQTENGWKVTAYTSAYELQELHIKKKIYAPVPYSASCQNLHSRNLPPFSKDHLLGTDNLGRDVLANLIYGSRNSVILAFSAVLLAAFLGFIFGSAAGYFGDSSLHIYLPDILILLFLSLSTYYYIFYLPPNSAGYSILLTLFSIFAIPRIYFHKWIAKGKKVPLPLDFLVVKLIEIINSIPVIFIIVALAAFLRPSALSLVILIGITGWTGMARLSRAETLKIKNMDYILSARAMGAGFWHILKVQMFPNILTSLMVAFAFSLAGAIILESTLSFLGIGLPPGTPSWGSMLAGYRYNLKAWWLAVFPGIVILLSVLCIHTLADDLEKQLSKV